MGIETASYISELVSTNPVGSVDAYSTADDHLRLIKNVLKTQFPNFTAIAVTANCADLNLLAGAVAAGLTATELTYVKNVTSDIQAQLDAKLTSGNDIITNAMLSNMADSTIKGRAVGAGTGDPTDLTAAQVLAILLGADGAGSGLDADLLDGQNGSFYQDSGNQNAGTLPDARLSSNIPRKDGSNTYTHAVQGISAAGGAFSVTDGAVTSALAATWAGTATNHDWNIRTNNTSRITVDSAGHYNFRSGQVTTNNATAAEVGYKGTPQNVQTGNYTLVLADAGKVIKCTTTAGLTVTIPDDSGVVFPDGTVIRVHNRTGGSITVTKTTSSGLKQNGVDGSSGARTLPNNSVCEVYKSQGDEWIISGPVT